MEQIKLAELHLGTARLNFDNLVKPYLLDAEDVETAMTKTASGYVYEIRYKQLAGVHFLADAVTIEGIYERLKDFVSLDKMRETIEGLAVQVGRLAAEVTAFKVASFAEKKPLKTKKK